MSSNTDNNEPQRAPIEAERPKPGPEYALPTTIGTKDHDPTKAIAPAYSIGMPHREDTSIVPGPNKYAYGDTITSKGDQKKPAYSMLGRSKTKEIELTPGPGFYSSDNTKYGKLSTERTPRSAAVVGKEAYQWKNFAPPPTKYFVPRPFGSGTSDLRGGQSWSIQQQREYGGSHYDGKLKKTPCPSRYGAVEPQIYKKRSPSYTQGGRTNAPVYNTGRYAPGPGSYNPQPLRSGKSQGSTFGTRHSTYAMPVFTIADVQCI